MGLADRLTPEDMGEHWDRSHDLKTHEICAIYPEE